MKEEGMSLERWSAWEARLIELQRHPDIVQRGATKALIAIREANGEEDVRLPGRVSRPPLAQHEVHRFMPF